METEVILSLGSNLGNREENLRQAMLLLQKYCGKINKIASLYQSEPFGFSAESDFLNTCISLTTRLSVYEVLNKIQLIERELGRTEKSENGAYKSRVIDIDIIFYGSEIYENETLKVPHSEYTKRLFVLLPLNEIATDLRDPLSGKSVRAILTACIDESAISIYKKDFSLNE